MIHIVDWSQEKDINAKLASLIIGDAVYPPPYVAKGHIVKVPVLKRWDPSERLDPTPRNDSFPVLTFEQGIYFDGNRHYMNAWKRIG